MSLAARRTGISLLTAYFAVAAVVGEAWHLLPGNDHYSGVLRDPAYGWLAQSDRLLQRGPFRLARGDSRSPLLTSGDFCPICQFLSKARLAVQAVPVPCSLPRAGMFIASVPHYSWAPSVATTGIRGPPGRRWGLFAV